MFQAPTGGGLGGRDGGPGGGGVGGNGGGGVVAGGSGGAGGPGGGLVEQSMPLQPCVQVQENASGLGGGAGGGAGGMGGGVGGTPKPPVPSVTLVRVNSAPPEVENMP